LDIDLSILGGDAVALDHYEAGMRQEHPDVPEALSQPGRAAILERFLARDRLRSGTFPSIPGPLMHALVHADDIQNHDGGGPPPCLAGSSGNFRLALPRRRIVNAQIELGLDNQMVDCRAREEWR
jgi:hypothetical protein